jgi:RNA polymerase sigma-70 factor (ECF subfamily)
MDVGMWEGSNHMYEEHRPLLFSIAYRMVGSVSESEDIVQEAFLRFHRAAEETEITSPRAYLSKATTRLSINHLKSARVRRESYVGPWLPEPVPTETAADDPEMHAETADSLSMAFLILLESLTPVERAVFLLHDVFDYGYDEIGSIVGKSKENCRQLATRARRQVEAKKPRFEASRDRREELSQRFFAAAQEGDTEGLLRLLAADVVAYGDSGGRTPGIARPVYGKEKVARLLMGFATRPVSGTSSRFTEINGHPGLLVLDRDGKLLVALALGIADDLVQTLWAVGNPDKLRHLGPVGDLRRLFDQKRRGPRSAGGALL